MPLSPAAAHRKDLTEKPAVMSHAHFRTIAAILREELAAAPITSRPIVDRFADALARTNPRFDRARFLTACTPDALKNYPLG